MGSEPGSKLIRILKEILYIYLMSLGDFLLERQNLKSQGCFLLACIRLNL